MGQASLNYSGTKGSLDINGIIENYYVYAGESISAGDFVEFINGVASQTTKTSEDTAINNTDSYPSEIISAVELSENRVFIAHNKDTSNYYLCGVICTIENEKIIVGTDTQLSTERYTGYQISTVLLGDGRVFIAHSYSTSYKLYGMLCTIEGSNITVNTDTNLASSYSGTGKRLSATKLTGSKVFVAHIINDTNYFLYATVISINGNTITMGTMKSLAKNSTKYSGAVIATTTLTSTNVFVAHSFDSNYYLHGVSVTINGTTISFVESSDIDLSSATQNSGQYIAVKALDNNRVLVTHCSDSSNTGGYLKGMVCTVSGTSTTKGTDIQLSTEASTGIRVSTPVLLANGKVLIAHGGLSSTGASYSLYSMTCNISGITITVESDVRINDELSSGHSRFPLLLSSGKLFIAHSLTASNYYLYAQLFSIQNDIPTNQITITEYETQIQPATSLPCKGVAKSSGEGGDDTGHKDMVSVYVPDVPTYIEFASNPAPTTWTNSADYLSATASNEYGEWSISAETPSIYNISYCPSKAFDDADNSAYMTNSWNDILDKVYLYLNCPEGVSLNPSTATIYHGNCGNSSYNLSKLQAYNGAEWVELATLTSSASTVKTDTFNLSEKEYYTAFRVEVTPGVQGNRSTVYNFKITSGTIKIE